MTENRNDQRQRVIKPAKIVFNDDASVTRN